MRQILIVEDDYNLSRGLCMALKGQEGKLVPCFTLKEAREQLASGITELVLLDINLPDGSGLTLLTEIKALDSRIPVILLTANDTELDVVMGLCSGADDYITKPFSLAILRARVMTQLRRGFAPPASALVIGDYKFDFDHMEFLKSGIAVELSKTEQKLLRLLVENRGKTMSREMLLSRIWTDHAEFVDENALSVTIKRLRDKLDAGPYIKTVYGLGYVWTEERNG